jgi:hypothetical protein
LTQILLRYLSEAAEKVAAQQRALTGQLLVEELVAVVVTVGIIMSLEALLPEAVELAAA